MSRTRIIFLFSILTLAGAVSLFLSSSQTTGPETSAVFDQGESEPNDKATAAATTSTQARVAALRARVIDDLEAIRGEAGSDKDIAARKRGLRRRGRIFALGLKRMNGSLEAMRQDPESTSGEVAEFQEQIELMKKDFERFKKLEEEAIAEREKMAELGINPDEPPPEVPRESPLLPVNELLPSAADAIQKQMDLDPGYAGHDADWLTDIMSTMPELDGISIPEHQKDWARQRALEMARTIAQAENLPDSQEAEMVETAKGNFIRQLKRAQRRAEAPKTAPPSEVPPEPEDEPYVAASPLVDESGDF